MIYPPPSPSPPQLSGTARENAVNVTVTTLTVTDTDEHGTPAWRTRYVVRGGDLGKNFAVETDPRTNDGRLYVIKPLDFETSPRRPTCHLRARSSDRRAPRPSP
ncbi:cadherin-2-like isoform X1 [Lampetra planeri]